MLKPDASPRLRRFETGAGMLALAAAIPVVLAVARAIAARWDYPGDLEWMEGATLVSAMRARDGLTLYGLPTTEYIPFIYPPLYAWVLGALAHVWPLSYTLGRSVSIACTVGAGGALVFGARREGAGWPLALATLGLFASTWDDAGSFFDLVRTDSLALCLLAWSLVLLPLRGRGWTIASGILLAVAFAAKQHVALVGIPMVLWLWRARGMDDAKRFVLSSAVPAVLFVLAMMAVSEGRFLTWLVVVPATHGQVRERLIPGAQLECWQALPLTTSVLFLSIPLWVPARKYWGAVGIAVLIVVSLMRGHVGGYLNVLMPMLWLLCLLPVAAAGAMEDSRVPAPAARAGLGLLMALQLTGSQVDIGKFASRLRVGLGVAAAWTDARSDLSRFVPSDADRFNVLALIEEIRELPEPILIPHAPWYAVLAGKRPCFALITLWDIDHRHGVYRGAVAEIDAAIATEFKSAVMPDDKLEHGFKTHWRRDHALASRAAPMRTGWGVRLRWVYVPDTDP